MKYVYAFICVSCNHRVVIHGMTPEDHNLYRCRDCGCVITQDSPVLELNRRQFEEWERASINTGGRA